MLHNEECVPACRFLTPRGVLWRFLTARSRKGRFPAGGVQARGALMITGTRLGSMRLLTGFICVHAEDLLERTIQSVVQAPGAIAISSICTSSSESALTCVAVFAASSAVQSLCWPAKRHHFLYHSLHHDQFEGHKPAFS